MKPFRKRMLANGLAMALVLSALATPQSYASTKTDFKDIKGHWAEVVIKDFAQKGYIGGYKDGTFRPNNNITRAEFIKIVNMAFGFTKTGSENFKDVKPGDWFYYDVLIAMNQGYIDGYGDKTFRPNDKITREEACKIVAVVLKANGYGSTKFKDDAQIASWAKQYVKGLVDMGIIGGFEDNTFRPKANTTRGESVEIINGSVNKKPSIGGGGSGGGSTPETSTEIKVFDQKGLSEALNSVASTIVVDGDIELINDLTVPTGKTLRISKGKTLTVNSKLEIQSKLELNGNILLGNSQARSSQAKIVLSKSATLEAKNGASLEFNTFEDIITPSQNNVLLYEGCSVKIGGKQYIGTQKNNAIIKLENYEGSNGCVAGYFLNGDGKLLLVIYESAEVIRAEKDIMDISLLVKAGNGKDAPGKLSIPNFEVIKAEDKSSNSEGVTYNRGTVVVESNAELQVGGENLVSKKDPNSVFNAQGGHEDNRRGIFFGRGKNRDSEDIKLVVNISGDVSMNKAFTQGQINPEYRINNNYYPNELYPTIDIKFNPVKDGKNLVNLAGIETPRQIKYKMNSKDNHIWKEETYKLFNSTLNYDNNEYMSHILDVTAWAYVQNGEASPGDTVKLKLGKWEKNNGSIVNPNLDKYEIHKVQIRDLGTNEIISTAELVNPELLEYEFKMPNKDIQIVPLVSLKDGKNIVEIEDNKVSVSMRNIEGVSFELSEIGTGNTIELTSTEYNNESEAFEISLEDELNKESKYKLIVNINDANKTKYEFEVDIPTE